MFESWRSTFNDDSILWVYKNTPCKSLFQIWRKEKNGKNKKNWKKFLKKNIRSYNYIRVICISEVRARREQITLKALRNGRSKSDDSTMLIAALIVNVASRAIFNVNVPFDNFLNPFSRLFCHIRREKMQMHFSQHSIFKRNSFCKNTKRT